MKFLTPLGLLGLLGVAALIIIYLIRPNYQQKKYFQHLYLEIKSEIQKEKSSYQQAEEYSYHYLSDFGVDYMRAYSCAAQQGFEGAGGLR